MELDQYKNRKVRDFLTFCRENLKPEDIDKLILSLSLIRQDKTPNDKNGDHIEIIRG